MSNSLAFFADSALTQPFGGTRKVFDREIAGDPVDAVVYLGSPNAAYQYVPDASGDTEIIVSISDADPANGFSASDYKLALTQSVLDSATAGDPLPVGASITGGAAGAIPIYIRFSGTSATPKMSQDISLVTNITRELPIS